MLPTPLQDPTMLMEVSETTWRSVFDAAGEPERLNGAAFKHTDIQESFTRTPPKAELFSALELIQDLGTDDGRLHIEQVAQDLPLALPISSGNTPAREFVAQLWVRGKADPEISELLLRAQLTHHPAVSTRTYREFVCAGEASTAPNGSIDKQQLKETISQWCVQNGKSDVISIDTRNYNGEWYCYVIRGDPIKRVPEVRKQRLGVLEYQPAAADLLRYDPKTGRVGIATRSPQLVKAYRETLGKLVAGDDQFFSGENVCSLGPLQEQGNALFKAHLPIGITRVDVVQLLWRRGDRDKVWVSGRDCFQILEDLQAKLTEGELIEARLKVSFSGGRRVASVTLKKPSIIAISGPHEELVERLLDSAGLRGSFNPDGTPRSFWSEHPWRMKEAEWRRRLGSHFERLYKSGLLRAATLEAVEHPDHPHAGRALDVVQVSPDVALGISADPAIGVRTLTPSDVEAYELQIPLLAREIQSNLALDGQCGELTPSSGLWTLGSRTFGSDRDMAVFLVLREPGAAATSLITAAASGATPVVLYPHSCRGIDGIASVPCRILHGPDGSLLERAIRSLNWHKLIPPAQWSAAALIVDSIRGVISYRGLELSIQPDTHPFKFALKVAEANGELVTTSDLNNLLSPQRLDNEAAKTAKKAFLNALKAAHTKGGQPVPTEEIFGSTRGGYCLKTTALILP